MISLIKNYFYHLNKIPAQILRGMTPLQIRHCFITIFLLSIMSLVVWLFEIVVKIGWVSLAWLSEDLFSPYLICLLVSIAYIQPFWIRYHHIDGKLILTTLTLFVLNVTVYILADIVLKGFFSKLAFEKNTPVVMALITALLFGLGYYFTTNMLIFKVKKKYALLFVACPILMFVLGIVTNFFIRGFATSWGFVDAVKMGFPQFWICILMGFLGIYISSQYEENTEGINIDTTLLDDSV